MWNKSVEGKRHMKSGYTFASLRYWCRNENPQIYDKITRQSVFGFIYESIKNHDEVMLADTDNKMAEVAYKLLEGEYICVPKKKSDNYDWYRFQSPIWSITTSSISDRLSTDVIKAYKEVHQALRQEMRTIMDMPENKGRKYKEIPEAVRFDNEMKTIIKIMRSLSNAKTKIGIIKEATLLFKCDDFDHLVNMKTHLFCFTNGVYDFQTKMFRLGEPEDYLTITCNNPYVGDWETFS